MALNFGSGAAARNTALLLRSTPRRVTAQFMRYHNTSSSPSSSSSPASSSSVSSDELRHFASLASSWWDPLGPSRILHLMNPVRHDFIASCLAERQPRSSGREPNRDPEDNTTRHTGLDCLDVGCGGGIFAESLARTIPANSTAKTTTTSTNNDNTTGAAAISSHISSLLAIDPSPDMIDLALSHARKDPTLYSHLQTGKFRYENCSLEHLGSRSGSSPSSSSTPTTSASASTSTPTTFDLITLFEVLEHTSSPQSFLNQCLDLLKPGGWLIGSTIARTWPSFVINQVIAEAPWPVGVVPRGTHEWSKFVNVDEVRGWAEGRLMETVIGRSRMGWKCVGAVYAPGLGWKLVPGAEAWGNYFWGIQKTPTL